MKRWSPTTWLLFGCGLLLTLQECPAQPRRLFRRNPSADPSLPAANYAFLSMRSRLAAAVPRRVADCTTIAQQQVADLSRQVEASAAEELSSVQRRWDAAQEEQENVDHAHEAIRLLEALLELRRSLQQYQSQVIRLRHGFAVLPETPARRNQLHCYLRIASSLTDLSGRIRYLLRDAVDEAAYVVDPFPVHFNQMLRLLTREEVSVAAEVLGYTLFDPDPNSGAVAYSNRTRAFVLELFAACRSAELLPALASFVRIPQASATLRLRAMEIIREIGLPQDPCPGQSEVLPAAVIQAAELLGILQQLPAGSLDRTERRRRVVLLKWLNERRLRGVVGDTFRVAGHELRVGDWLLMRNPSPYNRFTDLSPGLFTHVGIVSTIQDETGKRYFVIVDLPERGDRLPATNVDIYLQRSLHYWFLRHWDLALGRRMGKTAAGWISRPTYFDLTFRTDRVRQLPRPLPADAVIHTYCTGLLLMCVLQNGGRESSFFPITERAAPGLAADNLKQLGVVMGKEVVSPTGAMFGAAMQLVGRSEPMYEPGREIRESIYDSFAQQLVSRRIQLMGTFYQQLRGRLATLSVNVPWLAKALAKANNVSERMDLQAAAKVAMVVETLDQIAEENREQFEQVRKAFSEVVDPSLSVAERSSWQAQQKRLREPHQDLWRRWLAAQLTPRQLRIELLQYYVQRGQEEVTDRFFAGSKERR